jgi:Zn-dependent membrane protease YugP
MRPERKPNHIIIASLVGLGHRVRIKHNRQWNPVIVQDETEGPRVVFRIKNTGGICRVTIETADGDIYEGLFTNHSKLQYNKNFAVHVALQRAIKAMNEASETYIAANQVCAHMETLPILSPIDHH